MQRVIKPAGQFNIQLEDVPVPEPGPGEVRIKAVRSLISRGSEIGARYTRTHAVSPEIMGYSLAGTVDALGAGVDCYDIGDPVVALAPHAEYAVRPAVLSSTAEQPQVFPILDGVDFDQAPYWPLVAGAVTWVDIEEIGNNDTVVILGQGLVGSLMLQVARHNGQGRLMAVDALDSRCALAEEFGADAVVNAAAEDPVAALRRLTRGAGADIVVYAVGGPAGLAVFDQGLDMLAPGGLLHLIGLYEDAPLPLSSGKIQRRKILGGYYGEGIGSGTAYRAMQLLRNGAIQTERMTTHRMPFTEAARAFDLLYTNMGEALGVLLDWEA